MTMPPFRRILVTSALCLAAVGIGYTLCTTTTTKIKEPPFRVSFSPIAVTVIWEELTPQNVNNTVLLSSETSRTSYTPLQQAISENHVEGVRKCLALGADMEKRVECMHYERRPGTKDIFQGTEQHTPLHLAVFLKQYEIVELLLEAGADIEGAIGPDGSTPLIEAARWGDAEMVQLLLRKGANAQAETGGKWCWEEIYKGKTALDFAREGGHADCVQLLQDQINP